MKKFFVLLKKEIRELLTPLMIVPLVITMVMFFAIGKIAEKESAKAKTTPTIITLVDLDQTTASKAIISSLEQMNVQVENTATSINQAQTQAKQGKSVAVLVIQPGFSHDLSSGTAADIDVYTVVRSLSAASARSTAVIKTLLGLVTDSASNSIIASHTTLDPTFVKQPVNVTEHVIVGDQTAAVSLDQIMAVIQTQTYFIPIILFLVIIIASQLIATSIATEKENKTLETLLSAPVRRQTIVTAKLMAAGIVAMAFAAVYIIGMRSYTNGITGGAFSTAPTITVQKALETLGLNFGFYQYLMLGISLFFGILAALAIALILGAFAEDAKSVQGVVTPLMILCAVPYFLVLFLDINSISTAARYAIYAIPFSHPFLAIQNIALHNYAFVWYGIVYMAVIFVIFVTIASRIFSTDAIVTLKLNFSKRKP